MDTLKRSYILISKPLDINFLDDTDYIHMNINGTNSMLNLQKSKDKGMVNLMRLNSNILCIAS